MNRYAGWHESPFNLTDEEKQDILDRLKRHVGNYAEAYGYKQPEEKPPIQKLTVPPLINKEVTYKILRTKLFWDKFYSSFEVEDAVIIQ